MIFNLFRKVQVPYQLSRTPKHLSPSVGFVCNVPDPYDEEVENGQTFHLSILDNRLGAQVNDVSLAVTWQHGVQQRLVRLAPLVTRATQWL